MLIMDNKNNQDNKNSYPIIISILHQDYSVTEHAVIVNDSMTILEFKELINSNFDITDFGLHFGEIFYNSNIKSIDKKHLTYFLLKRNSKVKIWKNNVVFTSSINEDLNPPSITMSIGSHKWISSHIISYLLDKPVLVQKGSGFVFIITPNGKKYQGKEKETMQRFYQDGFNIESFATESEFAENISNDFDCFYINEY